MESTIVFHFVRGICVLKVQVPTTYSNVIVVAFLTFGKSLHSQSIGSLLFQDGLLLWHRDLLIVTVDGLVPIEHRPVDFLSRTGEQKVRGALASSHQSTRSPVPTKHDSP